MVQKSNFQIVLCPGRFPDPEFKDLYNKVYKCWHEVWSETFKEVDNNPNLHSDHFTRQDIIAAIFHQGECRALSLHRYTNKYEVLNSRDSYFANWSQLHIKKLCSPGPNILVSSYFTIHASGRGQNLGIVMKDYLLALTTEVYLNSNCDAMTGAARKNRKVHDVTYAWGATPVGIDVPSGHNDLVDLVAFHRPSVLAKRQEQAREHEQMMGHFNQLWEERLVIGQLLPETIEAFSQQNRQARRASLKIA